MSFLAVTIPVSLLIAGVLLGLVIWRVRDGDYEDWEGPAERMLFDDDSTPERED
jgi:cbb3-type cytochrome oxidase maturation protein